jgi:hypothetical protein
MVRICMVACLLAVSIVAASEGLCQSLLDEKWGSSFMSARDSQILDPEARHNLTRVTGLDGAAACAVVEKYRASFRTQSGGTAAASPRYGLAAMTTSQP